MMPWKPQPVDPELVKAQQALNDLNNARLDNLRIAMRPRYSTPRWFLPQWAYRAIIKRSAKLPTWFLKTVTRTYP